MVFVRERRKVAVYVPVGSVLLSGLLVLVWVGVTIVFGPSLQSLAWGSMLLALHAIMLSGIRVARLRKDAVEVRTPFRRTRINLAYCDFEVREKPTRRPGNPCYTLYVSSGLESADFSEYYRGSRARKDVTRLRRVFLSGREPPPELPM